MPLPLTLAYTSIGGAINYVTKKPTFQTEGSVTSRIAQYNLFKNSLDLNVKVSDQFALRMIGTLESAGSFREGLTSNRQYGTLVGKYLINDASSLSFNVDYLNDQTPRDFGLPIFEDRVKTGTDASGNDVFKQKASPEAVQRMWSNLDRTRFIGSPFNDRITKQVNGNVRYDANLFERGIFKEWKAIALVGYSASKNTYQQTGSGFRNKYLLLADGDIEITRTFEKGRVDDQYIGALASLRGKIKLGANVTSSVGVNFDYDKRKVSNYRYSNIANFDQIKLSSSDGQKTTAPIHEHSYKQVTNTDGYGASIQGLVSFYKKINVLLSLRYDNIEVVTPKYTYLRDYSGRGRPVKKGTVKEEVKYDGNAWSTSLGLVYKFTEDANAYASYQSGFELNRRSRLDVNGDLLPGYNQYQWEVGIKQSWFDQKLNLNLAYYNINTKSYIDVDGNGNKYEISNGMVYKGFELETSISPVAGWLLAANYSYIDAKYDANGSRKEGTRPQQTPEHQLGFSTSYRFQKGALQGLNLRFGGQYTGERLGNDYFKKSRRFPNPMHPYIQASQVLLNVGASYPINAHWRLNARVANLTDLVVFNSYRYGSVNPIAPRTLSLEATYRF